MNASVASQNKRREKICTARYWGGLRNKYGEHLVNLCESNIPIYSELVRTELYFLLKVQVT